MYTQSLLPTTVLLATTALAATIAPDPLSSLVNGVGVEGSSALSAVAPAATILDNFESTQTALPATALSSADNAYESAIDSGKSAAVPPYITALPSSVRPEVSSAINNLGGFESTGLEPALSSASVLGSSLGSAALTAKATGSASHSNSANSTGSPTSPSSGPSSTTPAKGGAGQMGVTMAAGALALGLTGVMALL